MGTPPSEPLTTAEIHRMLAAGSNRSSSGIRMRAMIGVIFGAGLRLAECLALEEVGPGHGAGGDAGFGAGGAHLQGPGQHRELGGGEPPGQYLGVEAGRRGACTGGLSLTVTDASRTWQATARRIDDILPEAVGLFRAAGAVVAALELRGTNLDIGSSLYLQLGLGPFPPTVDDPRRGPPEPWRVNGSCPQPLVDALAARDDRWLGA